MTANPPEVVQPRSGAPLTLPEARKWPGAQSITLYLVAGLGVALRVRAYLEDRSLWFDEAALAESVLNLPASALISQSLLYNQISPPGFLILTKLLVSITGESSLSLRAVPLFFSIATLALAVLIARARIKHPIGSVAFVTLLSISPVLIYYGTEFKHYSGEIFGALLIFFLVDRDTLARRPTVGFTLLALLNFFSFVAVPLGLLAIALYLRPIIRTKAKVRRIYPRDVVPGALFSGLALFAATSILTFLHSRLAKSPDSTSKFWEQAGGFPSDGNSLAENLKWVGTRLVELSSDLFLDQQISYPRSHFASVLIWAPVVLLIVVGMLTRLSDLGTQFILLSFLSAFTMGVAGIYPVGGRLSLYLAPFVAYLAAMGADFIFRVVTPRDLAALIVATLLANPILSAAQVSTRYFISPNNTHNTKYALDEIRNFAHPGDRLLVDSYNLPQVNVHQRLGRDASQQLKVLEDTPSCEELARLPDSGFWVLSTQNISFAKEAFVARLAQMGFKEAYSYEDSTLLLKRFVPPEKGAMKYQCN